MNRAAPVLVLVFALAGVSCMPELSICDFADVEELAGTIDAACWDQWCFVDEDGDGWARETPARRVDGECAGTTIPIPDGSREYHFGDCDDTFANTFPGNLEVCDGVDNDCDGEEDFPSEDEDDQDGLPRCARGKSVRLFLSGGTNLDGHWFQAGSPTVAVARGDALAGQIEIEVAVPNEIGPVAVVVIADWPPEHASGQSWSVFQPDELMADMAAMEANESFVHLSVPIPDQFDVPPDGFGDNETSSILVVVADVNIVGSPEHLASLTWPRWCCETAECPPLAEDPAPCDPVWNDEALDGPPADPEPGQLPLPPQHDLARLDELYLASCQTLGVTRLPVLVRVEESIPGPSPIGGPPCADALDPECQQIYLSLVDAGCVEIKLEVTDGGAG